MAADSSQHTFSLHGFGNLHTNRGLTRQALVKRQSPRKYPASESGRRCKDQDDDARDRTAPAGLIPEKQAERVVAALLFQPVQRTEVVRQTLVRLELDGMIDLPKLGMRTEPRWIARKTLPAIGAYPNLPV